MGGDGGVYAVKRKFIKECKTDKEELKAQTTREVLMAKAFTCAISGEPLNAPTVCCRLGYLFTKENVLSALLEKRLNESFSHIRRLKDVKTLIFEPNPDASDKKVLDVKYVCPVTQTPFDGLHKFIAIWSTGYVISEKALYEIGIDGLQIEYGPFSAEDVVPLLPSDEELLHKRAQLEAKLEVAKQAKQKKRRNESISCEMGAQNENPEVSDSKKRSRPQVRPASMGAAGIVTTSARESVTENEEKSDVYKNLFHTDADAKTSTRDLLMSVAGFRYTLS